MDDLLGLERFEQHPRWCCSGRIEGDDDEPTFVVERQGDRWLLTTADGRLKAVGDAWRDLIATDGGLARKPATRGFSSISANLLRRVGIMEWDDYEVLGSRDSQHAGRAAVDVDVQVDGYDLTVGVDAETGIWTWLRTDGPVVSVEELRLDPPRARAFDLLELVPDIDLTHREPVTPSLASTLEAVREATGLDVQVLQQDRETGEFRFIVLDDHNQPQALVSRANQPTPTVFAGVQHRWETEEEWHYHVDTLSPDHRWSRPIVKALEQL